MGEILDNVKGIRKEHCGGVTTDGHSYLNGIELIRVLEDAGIRNVLVEGQVERDAPIIKGKLSFDKLPSGFQVHRTDILETSVGTSSAEINAGISINVLMHGAVDFALADKCYHFSANTTPILFVSVINAPQIFTRYLKSGQRVKKVNISIDKHWLLARCKSSQEQANIESIFSSLHAVYQWPCTNELIALAEQLSHLQASEQLEDNLMAEQKAFSIFNQVFSLLKQKHKPKVNAAFVNSEHPKTLCTVGSTNAYEQRINEWLDEPVTLTILAKRLGTSISSLQRHFRDKHQTTVVEYIRHKKLERARRAMLLEGLSIGEVAYEAGYNHVSNFVTAFKKRFLITPAELKRRHSIK